MNIQQSKHGGKLKKQFGNFKLIGNSAHTTEFLALRKALNIYINYFTLYPNRQHVK